MRKLFTVGHQTNGKGPVFYGWNKGGNYLAVCGANRCLTIHDRQGKTVDQKTLSHTGPCVALEWDYTGETLAVLQQGSNQVMLWHSASRKIEALETGLKDLTLIKWNRAGPHLAVGTGKGNLLLYNKKTLKMNKIMMKHTKKITCGAWSMNGKLALSGEDKVLSISNSDGDLIDSLQLKEVPSQVQFSRMKNDGKNGAASESTVSMNLGGKTLLLVDLNNPQGEPVELAFSKDYGNVVSYKWFGDGYILIGFSAGQVVVVSTHRKEIVQEVSNFTAHSEDVADVTYCGALLKGASIGNSEVQVFNMNELSQIKIREDNKVELENEYKALQKVEWTDDGQILTVSSTNGNIHTFLTKIPVMHDAYGTRVLRLTSLRELVVRDALRGQDIAHLSVEIEPTFVSLGPDTCAVGMNNCVWYYALSASNDGDGVGRSTSRRQKPTSTASIVSQRSYVNTVQYVKLSAEYAAVMSEGMVTLHLINQQEATTEGYGGGHDERRQQRVFPERESESSRITSVAMTSRFMIFGTTTGCITYFSLEDWAILSEYRTSTGIRSVFPNANGTRLAFIDEANEGWIYSPVDDSMCPIENLQMDTDKILWDAQEWGLFVGCGSKKFTTYAYAPSTRWGAKCGPICKQTLRSQSNTVPLTTDKPHGFSPILAIQDRVVCQPSTQHQLHVVSLAARTHTTDTPTMLTSEQLQQGFFNRLGMNRLDLAWKFAKHMNKPEAWYALGDRALYLLDIEMAIRVYRTVQQPAMVLALDHLRHVNEKAMLLGHVALLFKNFNEAQNHFTKCSNPMLALEMRRDLMHWDAALALSRRLKPAVVPQISREYASQLEFRGELQAALKMYENGHVDIGAEGDVSHNRRKELENHNAQCQAGVARVMIRMGDLARGFSIAIQTETPAMAIECAQLFEELKQWTEAAQLYEKAELYDQAAQLYICKSKNLKAAANLMPLITSNKIQGLYGAAKEKEKDYPAAKKAYALAEDWDNVVRLLVSHLNDISSAYDVVRRTKSAEAAALVAKHCKKDGNPETAIEFLLLAKKTDEAFELASSNEKLHVFASILGDSGSNEDYTNLAKHYEKKKNFDLAGDYYKRCTRYDQALHRYLDAVAVLEAAQEGVQTPEALAEQEKAIDAVINKAIAVVGEAQSDKLNKTLIGFLTADGDNDTPKDPKYLFSLYMALGKYEKGCGLAIVIARREQTQGHYRVAHRLLFQTYKQLEKHDITISSDLRWNLQLLHSYLVVKPLMKALNDHDNAARMLIRVSKNIPKFPLHTVQILTSCVTECNKAAFDRSAYHYAKELVTSNDRKDIPEKHRKKIETIVRKPGYYSKAQEGKKKLTEADLTDPPEKVGPCPSCSAPLPMTMLDCPRCKSNVPYCIATGQHMLLDDWCVCPSCKFPALYSAFSQLVRQDEPCPMCEERVSLGDVRRITNPDPSIWQRAAMSIEPAGETGCPQRPPHEGPPEACVARADPSGSAIPISETPLGKVPAPMHMHRGERKVTGKALKGAMPGAFPRLSTKERAAVTPVRADGCATEREREEQDAVTCRTRQSRSAKGTGTHPVPATTQLLSKEKDTAKDRGPGRPGAVYGGALPRPSTPVVETRHGTPKAPLPTPAGAEKEPADAEKPAAEQANGHRADVPRLLNFPAAEAAAPKGDRVAPRSAASGTAAAGDEARPDRSLLMRVGRYRYSEGAPRQPALPDSGVENGAAQASKSSASAAHGGGPRPGWTAQVAGRASSSPEFQKVHLPAAAPRPSVQSSYSIQLAGGGGRTSSPQGRQCSTPTRERASKQNSSMFASRSPGPGMGHLPVDGRFSSPTSWAFSRSVSHSPHQRNSISPPAIRRGAEVHFSSAPSYNVPRRKQQPNLRGVGLGKLIRSSDAHLRATNALNTRAPANNKAFQRSRTYEGQPASPPSGPAVVRVPAPEPEAVPPPAPPTPPVAPTRPHVPTLSLIGKGLKQSKPSSFSRSRTSYGLGRY